MKAWILVACLVLAGGFLLVPRALGTADIASNVIDTSTSATATKRSNQRKVFYDSVNSRWWAFYQNGTNPEYSNSPDGSTWTSRGTTAATSTDFSLWPVEASTTVYLAFISGGVKVQKGTLGLTSITWGSPTTVDADSGDTQVNISRDSNGRLWVVYTDIDGGSCLFQGGGVDYVYAQRSTNPDNISSWGAQQIVDSISCETESMGIPVVIPMTTAGDMYFMWDLSFAGGGTWETIYGRLWDDSPTPGLGSVQQIDGSVISMSAVSGGSDTVHALYTMVGISTVQYAKYSGGAWAAPITLDANDDNQYASLSIDKTNGDNLYAFWMRPFTGTNSIYMKRAVSPYGSSDWDSTATALVSTGVNSYITSGYRDATSHIPLMWAEGSASPYNIRFYGKFATTITLSPAPGRGLVNIAPIIKNFSVSQSTSTRFVTFSYDVKNGEQTFIWVNLFLIVPGERIYDLSFPEFKTSGISVTNATSVSNVFTTKSGSWDPTATTQFKDRFIPSATFRLQIHDGAGGLTTVDSQPIAINPRVPQQETPPPGLLKQTPEPLPSPLPSSFTTQVSNILSELARLLAQLFELLQRLMVR